MDLLLNPIRLSYVEELSEKSLDIDFIKDFVDAKNLPCEIMYGTDTTMPIQAKLMTCSQHDFNGKTDAGVRRRGAIQSYTSRFLADDAKGLNTKMFSDEKHIYKRIEGFEHRFNSAEYKNAYFHLLVGFANELIIPQINTDQFQEICDENDYFNTKFQEEYEITENKNDLVHYKEICRLFGCAQGKEDRKKIANDMKKLNISYDKDKRNNGKGCYVGIKRIEEPEDEVPEMCV